MSQEFESIVQEFSALLTENVDPKTYFTKKKYAPYFEDYYNSKEPLFEKISSAYEHSDEKDALLQTLAQAISSKALSDVETYKGLKKENRKGELNLFMVTSVFPCILRFRQPLSIPLCEQIVLSWKQHFPKTELGYSTFEDLEVNFRSFWGFLTGR